MFRELKKNIEIKFGKPIRFQRDIKELKEDIYDVTGVIIGFNTLRRFFGFLNSVEPHRKTLNILSNYVGYGNYSKFLSKDKKDLLWDNWFYLNKFLKRDNFVESDFDWLLDLKSRGNSISFLFEANLHLKSLIPSRKPVAFNVGKSLRGILIASANNCLVPVSGSILSVHFSISLNSSLLKSIHLCNEGYAVCKT